MAFPISSTLMDFCVLSLLRDKDKLEEYQKEWEEFKVIIDTITNDDGEEVEDE